MRFARSQPRLEACMTVSTASAGSDLAEAPAADPIRDANSQPRFWM
jgi:hypothetical protein